MYSLIRALPLRRLVLEQGPALALSLVIAEMFYKFAFLVTWLVIDFAIQTCLRMAQRRATSRAT